MYDKLPPVQSARLTLADGQEITIRVTYNVTGDVREDPVYVPTADLGTAVTLVVDGDEADAATVGRAILDLIHVGEIEQRISAKVAANLDAVIAEAEAARDAGRDW